VFDIPLGDEDETEDPDLSLPTEDTPSANVPTDIPHLQLVRMEKCIIFTDRIL
jgi:hypothetical protein